MSSSIPITATVNSSERKLTKRIRRATILGTGVCVPERVVDNTYFSDVLGLDTSAEWIERRIGIVQRHWATDETSTDLAVGAARSALINSGVKPHEVDIVIVATSTPDYTMPATACLVQGRLGATNSLAFDIVDACAGYAYALDAATRYLQSEDHQTALVIGVDRGSKLVDPRDRTTSVFFGDGAGAAVVCNQGSGRVLASKLHSSGNDVPLSVPVGGTMKMDGKAIWNFATEILPSTIEELCAAADISVADIKLLVPHQANRNILSAAAEKVGLPFDRVVVNIERFGNTLAGSIPIALDDALASGRVASGDIIAVVGFGAGLAWAGLLFQL